MKKEKNTPATKNMASRAVPYTATMKGELLEKLDAIQGKRSVKIELAVKSYYGIKES